MRRTTFSFAASRSSGVKSAVIPDGVPVQHNNAKEGCIQDLVPCHVAKTHARTRIADIELLKEMRNRLRGCGAVGLRGMAFSGFL